MVGKKGDLNMLVKWKQVHGVFKEDLGRSKKAKVYEYYWVKKGEKIKVGDEVLATCANGIKSFIITKVVVKLPTRSKPKYRIVTPSLVIELLSRVDL